MLEMPGKFGKFTRSTSFTLPLELWSALKAKAAEEGVNESDIIRRALFNVLSEVERHQVKEAIAQRAMDPCRKALPEKNSESVQVESQSHGQHSSASATEDLHGKLKAEAKRKRRPA